MTPALLRTRLLPWLAAALAGCAVQTYEPRAVDPAGFQAAWLASGVDDAALRESLAQQGVDTGRWPLPAWDLEALTALAIARHPDLAVARAELQGAEAARGTARQRAGSAVEFGLEHHSADGASSSPWSLGVVFDAVVTGQSRRTAQADAADALALEAGQLAAQTAWQVRQRVRSGHRELFFAGRRAQASDTAWQLRRDISAAQAARLAHGAADAREHLLAVDAEAEAARQAAQARDALARARLALAAAVGLPVEQFDALTLRFDDLEREPPSAPAAALQREALVNRLDVRAALARYAAADASLRAELAKQWPEIVLKPGYAWDQGDNRWSLGLALSLPPGGRNQAPIEQARAQRELEAARCGALQVGAIATLDAARQALDAADAQRRQAQARWAAAQRFAERAQRRLQAGDADRVELLTARLAEAESQRQAVEAQAASWAALGSLEDAVQRPLDGTNLAPGGERRAQFADPAHATPSLP
ncbi:TolC family protein [Methylibium sp.]|uniref:TolC family protein n=1 Tax=Methylibium sp. TaxID=2067992 RepID=UPI003D09979F